MLRFLVVSLALAVGPQCSSGGCPSCPHAVIGGGAAAACSESCGGEEEGESVGRRPRRVARLERRQARIERRLARLSD